MADAARARRLAVRIREIVASTLEHQVKDPRLGMVTITDAKVTGDLREASVYYTVYGSDAVPKTAQDIEDALARAREIDAEVAAKRQGASFAGDADPYRQPRADDPDNPDEADRVSDNAG